jgi:glyoxylase-like metal-dependent hydrolase (beta-lactamase superfamily II)
VKIRNLALAGAISLGALGAGLALKSFLPQKFPVLPELEQPEKMLDTADFPAIEVSFLRCASVTWPEPVMVRGTASLAPCRIGYGAVLIRHPQATFLYDTGLCGDIYLFLREQSRFFRSTLARFTFEQSLAGHLKRLGVRPSDLDFALISHLHWDHIAGVPDIPLVPLRIARVEYEAAHLDLKDRRRQLLRSLLGDNNITLFECNGPPYEGFSASLDLFGDGSIVLVPLPGHTPGNMGMFINRSNGSRLFLLGDAAHLAQNYLLPATPHAIFWSRVTWNDVVARETLLDLHRFSFRHPEVTLIPMHDAQLQEACMQVEQQSLSGVR